jgi:hypothetical protein
MEMGSLEATVQRAEARGEKLGIRPRRTPGGGQTVRSCYPSLLENRRRRLIPEDAAGGKGAGAEGRRV